MDSKTFAMEMDKLGAFFRTEVSPETMAAYWSRFERADTDRFRQAISRCVDTRRNFPAVADIVAMIDRIGQERTTLNTEFTLPERSQGTVACLTCFDAKFVRLDVGPSHPDFGKAHPCPDCPPATRGPKRGEKAAYLAFLEGDKAERERLAPYREEHAKRHFAPVLEPMVSTTPPPIFADEVRERAAYVPVPTCITPFVIVAKKYMGRAGFVAQWASKASRAERGDASDWRESREGVRAAMVARYADVQEVKGG